MEKNQKRKYMNTAKTRIEYLDDNAILQGFKRGDGNIVKTYFYGYCRMAYCIYDKRYNLSFKPGMDFMSLAHEYYIVLCRHNFKQLEDRTPSMSLKSWMVNGFRYLVLDKLKAVMKEERMESFEERIEKEQVSFDIADNNFSRELYETIEEICDRILGRDNKNSLILHMLTIDGFMGKEVAIQLGITPSAVTQRYKKIMHDVVIPYFKDHFSDWESTPIESSHSMCVSPDFESVPSPTPRKCEFFMRSLVSPRPEVVTAENVRSCLREGRFAPDWINALEKNEIFVFGSNLAGIHGGGASRKAFLHFGAVMGQGVGLHGQSYAIPTMQGGVDTIRPYVNEFIEFAKGHPEKRFLMTKIGCGTAGFDQQEIAPLFIKATTVPNILLPHSFLEEYLNVYGHSPFSF